MYSLLKIAVISLLLIYSTMSDLSLYSNTNLYRDKMGIYRLSIVLEYFVSNKGNNEIFIRINEFLGNYCFESIHNDQFIEESYLVINDTVFPLQVINDCLKVLNDTLIEIPVSNSLNISVKLVGLVNQRLRIMELNRTLTILDKATIEANISEYGSTSLWNYTHPILSLVLKYIRKNALRGINPIIKILEYVNRNIVYTITFPSRYPWETIVIGSGDCDDQSSLIVTLLRGLGFKAYLESGIVFLDHRYLLSFSSSNTRFNYTYIGGFMHSWVILELGENLFIRIDPVVAKPYSNPTTLISNAYYYARPVFVLKTDLLGEDYILKTHVSMLEFSNRNLYLNVTLRIYAEELLVS
ncbi:MAG: transglutaminase family protein [Desulfurococcaceae archaeon]